VFGYNLHAGHFLVGVEGDLDWAGFTHPNLPIPTPVGPVLFSAKQDWIRTVAARFGLTFDRWLAYGKVGGGWARDVATLNLPNGTGWTASSTNSGWLAGGGLEYGFKPNWTVKLEYDYLALGNWTTSTVPAGTWSRDVQMIKAGINYKFERPARVRQPPFNAKRKTPASDEDTETRPRRPRTLGFEAKRRWRLRQASSSHPLSIAPRTALIYSPSSR
jgi:hypothetical protein